MGDCYAQTAYNVGMFLPTITAFHCNAASFKILNIRQKSTNLFMTTFLVLV